MQPVDELNGEQSETKFERWVKHYKVTRLLLALQSHGGGVAVTFAAVYQWMRGENEPRGPKARALIEISNGEISAADLNEHFSQKERSRRKAASTAANGH